MTRAELHEKLRKRLAGLSEERLRVADDFLAYLAEIESAEATDELLRMPGLADEIKAARRDADSNGLSSLDEVRWKE